MAKTADLVKNSSPVPKTTSPRDSQADLDTVLVVGSEEVKKARAAVESVTSETATVDCHPVILDDNEDATDRYLGAAEGSSSGLVAKPTKVRDAEETHEADRDPDTTTLSAQQPVPLPTMVDAEEAIEISLSGVSEADITPTREKIDAPPAKSEPRATITELREVDPVPPVRRPSLDDDTATKVRGDGDVKPARPAAASVDDDTATKSREKPKAPPRFDDETMPMPKPELHDIAGALETVPLNAAMVQNVIAQVDARAAARQSGRPVPRFALSPIHPNVPNVPSVAPVPPPPQPTPRRAAPQHGASRPPQPMLPPRRVGLEVFITIVAFLAVAVPALYFLYTSFAK